MRVIALIDDPRVVRRILEHPGRWAAEPASLLVAAVHFLEAAGGTHSRLSGIPTG
jgi:hypothetical protein